MRVLIEFSTLHLPEKTIDAIVHLPGVVACHRLKASTLHLDVMLSRVPKTVRDVKTLLGAEEGRMDARLEKENAKIDQQRADADRAAQEREEEVRKHTERLPPAPPDLNGGFDTRGGAAAVGAMVELDSGLIGEVEKRTLVRPATGGAFETALTVRVGKKTVRALERNVRLITGA